MEAIQKEITYTVREVEKDGEFTMKIKKDEKTVGKTRPLMDSTLEIEAITQKAWEDGAREQCRYYSLRGQEFTTTKTFWQESKEVDRGFEVKGLKKGHDKKGGPKDKNEDVVTPPIPIDPIPDPIPVPDLPDPEMTLPQLRAKYPEIKATSKASFLKKLEDLKK